MFGAKFWVSPSSMFSFAPGSVSRKNAMQRNTRLTIVITQATAPIPAQAAMADAYLLYGA